MTRLLDKDYDPQNVQREFQHALGMNRESLLEVKSKPDSDDTFKWAMFSSFSIQHRQVKAIFSKHWDILKNDRILTTSIPDQAKVIIRGAPILQSKIAPNVITPPRTCLTAFFHVKGVPFANTIRVLHARL